MSKEFDIKIDKSLLRLDKSYKKAVVTSLVIMGDKTENEIKRTKKFKDRSGDLRRKILRDKVNTRELSVEVKSTVADPPYGLFLNDGTKSKTGKTKIVAMRFMENGLAAASKHFERILVAELDKRM